MGRVTTSVCVSPWSGELSVDILASMGPAPHTHFPPPGYVSPKQCEVALQKMGVIVSSQDLDEILRVSKSGKPYSRSGEVRVNSNAMLEAIHAFMPDMDPVGVPSSTERMMRRGGSKGVAAIVHAVPEDVPAGRRIV